MISEWIGAFNYVQNFDLKFFFDTNHDAPKGKIISIDLSRPDKEFWDEVLPETKNVADANHLLNNNTLAVRYLAEGAHILKVYELPDEKKKNASFMFDVPLPGLGNIESLSGRSNDTDFFYKYGSFSDPGGIYHVELKKSKN